MCIETPWRHAILLLAALLVTATPMSAQQSTDPLAAYRWKNRPLLVFAPASDQAAYRSQLQRIRAEEAGFRERDMVLISVLQEGGSARDGEPLSAAAAATLRRRYRVAPGDFAVILVGKDGGAKERWAEPAGMEEVFRTIDGMPMRRQEMRRRGDD